jgi:hypothetical protein
LWIDQRCIDGKDVAATRSSEDTALDVTEASSRLKLREKVYSLD